MLRDVALGAGLTALLFATPAHAHHPSGAGTAGDAGPIITIPGTTLEKDQSSAAVVFEYISFNALSDAQLSVPGHPHSLDAILVPSLLYSYGITNDLTLTLRLPFVRRTNIREGHVHGGVPEVDVLGDSAGVGDLSVFAQYRLLNNRATQTELSFLLGLQLPTGDTSVSTAGGERFETEFQPGSGAWDGMFGLSLTKRVGLWSFDANILYVLATEGAQETNLGNRFQYNAALSYRFYGGSAGPSGRMSAGALPEPMYHGGPKAHAHQHGPDHTHDEAPAPKGPAFDLVLEINGEWHAHQEIAGVRDPNSGGNVVFLSPGLRLSYERWSGFVSVGVPVINDLNGLQAEPSWRVLTGVAVNF
jgi:Putative MetA-pathway of phenol degradation